MPARRNRQKRPGRPGTDPATDGPVPIDEVGGDATAVPEPPVKITPPDEEGGADPIDPDTGRPYVEKDPGTATPPATRRGGTSDD